jgi:YHS domain-containing protein
MKQILFLWLLSCIILPTGCNRQNKTTSIATTAASHNEKEVFKNTKVDNTNDLVCRMPLTAGVGDTAHYSGKVYGFCSKGCKEKFVKSPAEYLASQ